MIEVIALRRVSTRKTSFVSRVAVAFQWVSPVFICQTFIAFSRIDAALPERFTVEVFAV